MLIYGVNELPDGYQDKEMRGLQNSSRLLASFCFSSLSSNSLESLKPKDQAKQSYALRGQFIKQVAITLLEFGKPFRVTLDIVENFCHPWMDLHFFHLLHCNVV
jgi:hypothetical protein